ncbi:TetR/AcrR family transcriptional regulator [Actinospica robiniae]|uniref:TetR/AcrR family transcriptional regulator n=1 Tax=Actinospica robiniae TaxID=304901 RepID=UPI0004199806|nr:TetR/AcrR family transcriptional regulator [Actinospica robiniae]
MTARAEAALATRDALLDAGLRVAEEHGLSGMSVNRVVAGAGVAKGTFYVHFADRDAFLDALHRRYTEQSGAAVAAAMDGHAPSWRRLRQMIEAYFESSMRHRGVKALALEVRNAPGVAAKVDARNAVFVELAEPDLEAMGWPDPRAAARLVVAMAAELMMAEMTAGEPDEAGRAALWTTLERMDLARSEALTGRAS